MTVMGTVSYSANKKCQLKNSRLFFNLKRTYVKALFNDMSANAVMGVTQKFDVLLMVVWTNVEFWQKEPPISASDTPKYPQHCNL